MTDCSSTAERRERAAAILAVGETVFSLRDRVAALERALRPFADACTISTDDDADVIDDTLAATKIRWADLRHARALLTGATPHGK